MIDLKAIAGERWKITLDESATDDTSREDRLWFYRISGKRGHIYVHGTDRLGVWTDNRACGIGLPACLEPFRINGVIGNGRSPFRLGIWTRSPKSSMHEDAKGCPANKERNCGNG